MRDLFLLVWISVASPDPTVSISSFSQALEFAHENSLFLKKNQEDSLSIVSRARERFEWRNPEFRGRYQRSGSRAESDLEIRIPVRNPFEMYHERRAYRRLKESEKIQIELLRWDFRCNLKQAYYHMLTTKVGLALAKERLNRWRQLANVQEGGRAELGLYEAESEYRDLEHEASSAKDYFLYLSGLAGESVGILYHVPSLMEFRAVNPESLAVEDLGQLRLVQYREAKLREEEALYRAQRSKRVPWISRVEAGYQISPIADHDWHVGASLEVPLFQSGSARAQALDHGRNAALIEYKLAKQKSELDIIRDRHRYESALAMLESERLTLKRFGRDVFDTKTSLDSLNLRSLQEEDKRFMMARLYLRRFMEFKVAEVELERSMERDLIPE